MPRGWSLFGTSDEEASPTRAPDTHDEQDTASTNLVRQHPVVSTVSTTEEVIEGGNFPCIVGAPRAVPASSDVKLSPLANGLPGWSAIDFKRNDSASSIELTGGDFPSLSSMIDPSAAMSSPLAVKNSTPSRSRPGLPPPAPRSPLALTFSRRGGRPLNNANTAVTKNGSPATSPSKTRFLLGTEQQGSPRALGSSKLPTSGRRDNQGADSNYVESAADLVATSAASLSSRDFSEITSGHETAASTTTFVHKHKITIGSSGSVNRGDDATVSATAPPSCTSSLGPPPFISSSSKQIVVGGDVYGSRERSTLGNGSVVDVEQQQRMPQPPFPSSKSKKSLHQRAPSAVNPLTASQLAPFVKQCSAPKFSARSLSSAEKLLGGSSAGYAGTSTPETSTGSATAQAPIYDSSAHPQAKSGDMIASAKPAAPSCLGTTDPLPPLSTSRHQEPAMNAPSSATADAALGQPWSGTRPAFADGSDSLGGGDAVAGVYDPAAAGGSSGRVIEVEESEANPRDSSQRGSSISTNAKSLAGRGFLGCFPRRAQPAQEQPNTRALPTHPASFRVMASSSKSATPMGTPKATPGRFRVKKRPSFGRQPSQDGRVSPPVPVMDLPPRSTRQRTRGASDATAIVEDKSSEVVEAGEDVVKDAVRGGVDRGDNEEAKAGEGQANVEQGDGAAEEKEEAEAIVAEFVRMRGSLECGRAMRMDGIFVGQLLSTGSITVGPTGQVTGDLKGLKSLRVEGQVVGDVVCDNVMVLNRGKIYGDVTAVNLTIGSEATVRGRLNVVSDASGLSEAANSTKNPNAAVAAENHTNKSATISNEADQSEAADTEKSAGKVSEGTSFEPSAADKLDDNKWEVEQEKLPDMTESDKNRGEGEAEEKHEVRPVSIGADEEETLIEKTEIAPGQIWSSDEEGEGETAGEVQAVVISPEKRQETEQTIETSIDTANDTERKRDTNHDSCASVVQVTMYQQATKDGATATSSDTDFASDEESTPVPTLKQPVLAAESTTTIEQTPSSTAPMAPDIAAPVLPESGTTPEVEGGNLFSKHGEVDDERIDVLSEEYSSAGSVDVSSGSGDDLM